MVELTPGMSGTSTTTFPTEGTPDVVIPAPLPQPFRRISLPSAPNVHRQSIVSTISFNPLAEENHIPGATMPAVIKSALREPKNRPSSVELGRRAGRRREVRVIDEKKETKRKQIINEFRDTERTYVDGLELIYSHFLMPIIASLDTPHPLLDRSELTSVFSNFIDIWNLHRSFYSSLTAFLDTSTSTNSGVQGSPPPISPILLSHFPYLSLYTPFVSSFPDAMSSYNTFLSSNTAFASFIATQESDIRCGKLKLRDWLLTIVQRCPRYLLLLKDLIECTNPDDPEYGSLTGVHALVAKITVSLNTSVQTHAQTLALLSLQRSTSNLPFQLITPGRSLLKRASLLQLSGSVAKEREFLLFSDLLIWLAPAEHAEDRWEMRPPIVRTRSKSDADLSYVERRESGLRSILGGSPVRKSPKVSRNASSGTEERWVYKGHVDLIDVEVVAGPHGEPNEERRLEILSPEKSFAIYTTTDTERDEWSAAIRNTKATLLMAMNATHPNSTLTSSASTAHLRRTLQALPYAPSEEPTRPKRGKVEHFVPAIWIPDGKTESCMRCGRTFGWRRRRHHCRLCGRCICSSCSGKTFFIFDSNAKHSHKAARACDACYDTVFPVINPTPAQMSADALATHSHLTLSGLRSMPSILLPSSSNLPAALMTLDSEGAMNSEGPFPAVRIRPPSRPRSYIQLLEEFEEHDNAVAGSPSASHLRQHVPDERDEDSIMDQSMETDGEQTLQLRQRFSGYGISSAPVSPRREDTARRHKRFSMPALALQTTPVTTRPDGVGEGRSKRFSLVMGMGKSGNGHKSLGEGAAAGRLSELLGRTKERV